MKMNNKKDLDDGIRFNIFVFTTMRFSKSARIDRHTDRRVIFEYCAQVREWENFLLICLGEAFSSIITPHQIEFS